MILLPVSPRPHYRCCDFCKNLAYARFEGVVHFFIFIISVGIALAELVQSGAEGDRCECSNVTCRELFIVANTLNHNIAQ